MGCHPTRVAVAGRPPAVGLGWGPLPHLITIVYVSRRTPGCLTDAVAVADLLRRAETSNRRHGITGYLVMAGDHFLQRLEGPEGALASLLDRLQGDTRHTQVTLVERRRISSRSYPSWSMKSVELSVNARDPTFDAMALVLESLSVGVSLGARFIPPPVLKQLRALQSPRHPLPDALVHAVVITVSLGASLLAEDDDRRVAATPSAIGAILRYLRDRIVSLQLPDGHGAAVLCTGMAFQVVLPAPPEHSHLHRRVMRACRDLVTSIGAADVRVAVVCGRVTALTLRSPSGRHCGRFLAGAPARRGLATAHAMHAADYSLAAEPSLALAALDDDAPQQPVWLAGQPLHAIPIPGAAKAPDPAEAVDRSSDIAMGDGPAAQTCEEVAAAFLPSDLRGSDGSIPDEPPGPDVALEWMYQLDVLSKEFDREQQRRGKFGSPGRKASAFSPPRKASVAVGIGPRSPSIASSTISSVGYVSPRMISGCAAAPRLLTIAYISTLSEDAQEDFSIANLGPAFAAKNAQRGLTGFLLFARPHFLQFLEGPPEVVKGLFQRIQRDPRHTDVTILTSRLLPARQYGGWAMKVVDLQTEGIPDVIGPLRDSVHLLARQFVSVCPWLPRLDHDLLLAAVRPSLGAAVQCSLAAFALAPPLDDWGDRLPTVLASLDPFLSRGGSLVGMLGPYVVGYVFAAHIPLLLEVVAQACASFVAHAGLKTGNMLLLNVGPDGDPPDLVLLGPLFEEAAHLAAQAAAARVALVADARCRVPHPLVTWEPWDQHAWIGHIPIAVPALDDK